jgi:hypothetical protein
MSCQANCVACAENHFHPYKTRPESALAQKRLGRSQWDSVPPACGTVRRASSGDAKFPTPTLHPHMGLEAGVHIQECQLILIPWTHAQTLPPFGWVLLSSTLPLHPTHWQGLAHSPAGQPFSPGTFSYPGQHS